MSLRQKLYDARENFWKEKINGVKDIIEETIVEYQESLDYADDSYELELYLEKKEDVFYIYLMINKDEEVEIARFTYDVAVVEFLSRICLILETEEVKIFDKIDNPDFSKGEKFTLCKGKILLN